MVKNRMKIYFMQGKGGMATVPVPCMNPLPDRPQWIRSCINSIMTANVSLHQYLQAQWQWSGVGFSFKQIFNERLRCPGTNVPVSGDNTRDWWLPMISEKECIRISKFLSLVLRHKPESIGILLDENGWTDVDALIEKSHAAGVLLNRDILKHVVETNSKKRFAFNASLDRIRANQGHSVEIELGYKPQAPPEILYHGTGMKSLDSILIAGIEKRNRHHVHLSNDVETAVSVGKRHGKPVVFAVFAGQMADDTFEFFLSDNGVWLTDYVPTRYLWLQREKGSQ